MTSVEISGIVRALVAAAGGYAMGKGWGVDAELVATVGGAAATIIVAVWSVIAKRRA
jgi:hypothetical protein